jgi:glycogen phosphorylase
MDTNRRIAYFSMEIGLDAAMPTYSGGLGILAGDTIRAAADLKVPMVAVTLLYRKGYFYQKLDSQGRQTEEPVDWSVDDFLQEMPQRVRVNIEGRDVHLRAWKYGVASAAGYEVPVYFLDTDLAENAEWDRRLTDSLYGGDQHYRLCQETILGIGGVRMLRALGYQEIERFHMNEGHASLLTLELLDEQLARANHDSITPEDLDAVRRMCVFTTHTPVAAGHDQFPLDLANRVLGPHEALNLSGIFSWDHTLNMTYLALSLSHYVNGVAKRHGEVSQHMFSSYQIDSITNGVHAATWTSQGFQMLFDKYIPGWKDDNFSLRYALSIPRSEIWEAHIHAKQQLLRYVNRQSNVGMDADVFTIGLARRITPYKRPDLLFADIARLRKIHAEAGPIQIVYAGKAHPQDQPGKDLIAQVFGAMKSIKGSVKAAFLPNYDMELGKLITGGVDLWLNTPQAPLEASGTSGMKAAMNGVPSLSILDGWWIEGCIDGVTGWAIGEDRKATQSADRAIDASLLYDKLQNTILPLYYKDRDRFCTVMAHAIALNGSFFNTQRMVQQYVLKAYFG